MQWQLFVFLRHPLYSRRVPVNTCCTECLSSSSRVSRNKSFSAIYLVSCARSTSFKAGSEVDEAVVETLICRCFVGRSSSSSMTCVASTASPGDKSYPTSSHTLWIDGEPSPPPPTTTKWHFFDVLDAEILTVEKP